MSAAFLIPPPLPRAIARRRLRGADTPHLQTQLLGFARDRLFKIENISNTEMSLTANIITNFFLVIAMALYVFLGYMLFRYAKVRAGDDFFVRLSPRGQTLCIAGLFAAALAVYMLVAAFGLGYYSDIDWYGDWGNYVLKHCIYNFYRDCDADYPPLFLYVNTALTWFANSSHAPARFVYKAFFGLATVLSGIPFYFVIKRRKGAFTAAIFTVLYLFAPVNLTDSAAWGQSDTLITCAAVVLYDFLSREKWLAFFAAALVAMLVKTQIILLMPAAGLYLICLMIKRRLYLKFILYAVCALILYIAMYLPFGLTYIDEGNLLFLIDIFGRQVGHYPYLSANAGNIWSLFGLNYFSSAQGVGAVLKNIAYALTVAASVLIFIAVIRSRAEKNLRLALMFALQGTACYLLLPAMHERYWVPVAGVMLILLALCGNLKTTLFGLMLIGAQGLNILYVLFETVGMFTRVLQWISVICTIVSAALICIAAYKALFPERKFFGWMDDKKGGSDDGKSVSAER